MYEFQEALARIESLIQLGLPLAMSTTGGRIVLTKLAANLDPSWIPSARRDSLGAALEQAAASRPDPIAIAEVEEILCEAWSVRRVTDALDSLEDEPAAVTFSSQVHRGAHEGKPVAVKILRPGLASAIRQDLALLDALLGPVSGAFPEMDPPALLAEARERVMDELDLENEAQLMRRFNRGLRADPVTAPTPVTDLCTETVLVSSWLEGQPLEDGAESAHDSSAAALLQFVIGGIREGLVHCDLDAADVLMLYDGRLGVLDFGAVAAIERGRADLALAVVDAFIARDPAALDDALVALGLLAQGHGAAALTLATQALGPLGGTEESRLDVEAVAGVLQRLARRKPEALELLDGARLMPGDLYPWRGIAQLFSLIARLGASGVWCEQVRAALTMGWHA